MALEHESDTAIAEAVRIAGGQSQLGRKIGRPQTTVHSWLKAGRITANDSAVLDVERETGVPKERLRPEAYPTTPPEPARDALEPAR